MPHYTPAGNQKAHGLVIAHLKKIADADQAMLEVHQLPTQGHMQIATISHFEDSKHAGRGRRPAGEILAVFTNSDDFIGEENAHTDMDNLVSAIDQLGYFKTIEHY